MCGIVAYVGHRPAMGILVDGLRRLEYRGYDSAGVAMIAPETGGLWIRKAVGRVSDLEAVLHDPPDHATVGLAHTRWATHGAVTQNNAHPHTDALEHLAIVHNGVIENADRLRTSLQKQGITFRTETDTEVIAHLIRQCYTGDPAAAVAAALRQLQGTLGVVALFKEHPDQFIVARLGSPLVVGLGDGESIIASDPQAIVNHTRTVVYLNDREIAVVRADDLKLRRFEGGGLPTRTEVLDDDYALATKEGYPHFMAKEIAEQPEVVERCMAGRLRAPSGQATLGGLGLPLEQLADISAVIPVGCGTGYHAGMLTAMAVEHIARIPARAERAVDLRSRVLIPERKALYLAISQSGETADLIAVVKELQLKGCRVAGVINAVGSTLARLCGRGVYIHAGPEVAVASTKAFTGHVTAGLLLGLMLGRSGVLSSEEGKDIAAGIAAIPDAIRAYLANPGPVEEVAAAVATARYAMFIGRGFSYPVALEGALKLKELAYVPCTGYHAGEMKHGPIAMLEKGTPVIAIVPRDSQRDRTLVNMHEAAARGARLIGIHTAGDREVAALCDISIPVPEVREFATPLVTSLPLQLLAYHAALAVGADVDRPRNLAKSVTVE